MPDRTRPLLVALLAVATAGAIAAIASVATRLRTVERTERAARGDPVLRLEPFRAKAIRISSGSEELRLERTPAGWRLVAPIHAQADPAAVAGLLEELSALERRATVASPGETAERLQPYGLDAPRTRIEVTMDGDRVERLAFGGDTGADGATFVMATGGEVALVSSAARAGIEKRLADLRAFAPARTRPEPVRPIPLRARPPRSGG